MTRFDRTRAEAGKNGSDVAYSSNSLTRSSGSGKETNSSTRRLRRSRGVETLSEARAAISDATAEQLKLGFGLGVALAAW